MANNTIRRRRCTMKSVFNWTICVFQFPYCDGAHTKHNEETGDNVGPLIIKKKDA